MKKQQDEGKEQISENTVPSSAALGMTGICFVLELQEAVEFFLFCCLLRGGWFGFFCFCLFVHLFSSPCLLVVHPYEAKNELARLFLLPLPPDCWDHRHAHFMRHYPGLVNTRQAIYSYILRPKLHFFFKNRYKFLIC